MNHSTTRATILPEIIHKIMAHDHLNEDEALKAFYSSAAGASFADDETGLYGQSPNYIFGLYLEETHGSGPLMVSRIGRLRPVPPAARRCGRRWAAQCPAGTVRR